MIMTKNVKISLIFFLISIGFIVLGFRGYVSYGVLILSMSYLFYFQILPKIKEVGFENSVINSFADLLAWFDDTE